MTAPPRSTPSGGATRRSDLDEWFFWGRPLRWIHARFGITAGPRTFPAWLPLLALDRIWVEPAPLLPHGVRAHRSRLARWASDHLPVVARLGR